VTAFGHCRDYGRARSDYGHETVSLGLGWRKAQAEENERQSKEFHEITKR
jgi:hypothetical protein